MRIDIVSVTAFPKRLELVIEMLLWAGANEKFSSGFDITSFDGMQSGKGMHSSPLCIYIYCIGLKLMGW